MRISILLDKCRQLASEGIIGQCTYKYISEAFKSVVQFPRIGARFLLAIEDLVSEIEQERAISDMAVDRLEELGELEDAARKIIQKEEQMESNNSYYTDCCTTSTMVDTLKKIRDVQGEEFPIKVRFTYLDDNGETVVKSGLVTGTLDNGDEVFIDAKTIDVIMKNT